MMKFGPIRAEKTRFEVTYLTLNKMKYFRLHLSDEVGIERPETDPRQT